MTASLASMFVCMQINFDISDPMQQQKAPKYKILYAPIQDESDSFNLLKGCNFGFWVKTRAVLIFRRTLGVKEMSILEERCPLKWRRLGVI